MSEANKQMTEHSEPIVVGVDGSDDAVNAARWAASVATRYQTSLHIVHALPSIGHSITDTVAAMRASVMSYQRDCAEIFLRCAEDAVRSEHPGLEVTTLSTDIPVDEVLIQTSGSARMIVVGSTDVSAAGALVLGSTTLSVVTHAKCPVVAWRGPNVAPTDSPIVVGVDDSDSAASALDAGFEFADRFDLKLAAVRSWSKRRPVSALAFPFPVDWDAIEAAEWVQLTNKVDRYNMSHIDVDARCFVETSGASAALLRQIEVDCAQLVVVGNRGRDALASAAFGSTTLNLLHHSPVPVMVCHAAHRDRSTSVEC